MWGWAKKGPYQEQLNTPVFISLYRNYQFINYFEEAGIVFLLKPGLTAMFPYHDFQSVFVPFGVKKKKLPVFKRYAELLDWKTRDLGLYNILQYCVVLLK